MLIDWFTVAAQIVNFLLLASLLKLCLYGRILRAIEAREARIAARLAEAEEKERAAGEQLAVYEGKLHDFEQQQESLLANARLEAERRHDEMLAKARAHVRSLEADWQADLDRQRSEFLADLRRRAASEILALTRKTIADLACVDIQRCAVQVFLEKIRLLDREACQKLAATELLIKTAFDLPEDTKAEIRGAIQERLDAPVRLQFEKAPGIGLGLELRGNGWRIGWSSEAYLERLEESLQEILAGAGPVEHPVAAGAHAGSR